MAQNPSWYQRVEFILCLSSFSDNLPPVAGHSQVLRLPRSGIYLVTSQRRGIRPSRDAYRRRNAQIMEVYRRCCDTSGLVLDTKLLLTLHLSLSSTSSQKYFPTHESKLIILLIFSNRSSSFLSECLSWAVIQVIYCPTPQNTIHMDYNVNGSPWRCAVHSHRLFD